MKNVLLTLKLKRKMKSKRSNIEPLKILLKLAKKPLPVLFILALASCETLPQNQQSAEQPLDEHHLIALGDRANQSGDWQTAVTFYQQAHLTAPGSSAPLLAMAETFEDVGSYDNAARVYYQLANASEASEKVAFLKNSAQSWIRAQEANQAITVFDEARTLAPEDPAIELGIGISHDLKADFSRAQEIYQRLLQKHPHYTAASNNLGLSYLFTGDTDLAIRYLSVLGEAPDAAPQHRFNLAMAYGMAGRMEDAERILREMGLEASVGENLSGFEDLRTMSPPERAAFVYGSQFQAPTRPVQ